MHNCLLFLERLLARRDVESSGHLRVSDFGKCWVVAGGPGPARAELDRMWWEMADMLQWV